MAVQRISIILGNADFIILGDGMENGSICCFIYFLLRDTVSFHFSMRTQKVTRHFSNILNKSKIEVTSFPVSWSQHFYKSKGFWQGC